MAYPYASAIAQTTMAAWLNSVVNAVQKQLETKTLLDTKWFEGVSQVAVDKRSIEQQWNQEIQPALHRVQNAWALCVHVQTQLGATARIADDHLAMQMLNAELNTLALLADDLKNPPAQIAPGTPTGDPKKNLALLLYDKAYACYIDLLTPNNAGAFGKADEICVELQKLPPQTYPAAAQLATEVAQAMAALHTADHATPRDLAAVQAAQQALHQAILAVHRYSDNLAYPQAVQQKLKIGEANQNDKKITYREYRCTEDGKRRDDFLVRPPKGVSSDALFDAIAAKLRTLAARGDFTEASVEAAIGGAEGKRKKEIDLTKLKDADGDGLPPLGMGDFIKDVLLTDKMPIVAHGISKEYEVAKVGEVKEFTKLTEFEKEFESAKKGEAVQEEAASANAVAPPVAHVPPPLKP